MGTLRDASGVLPPGVATSGIKHDSPTAARRLEFDMLSEALCGFVMRTCKYIVGVNPITIIF